MKATEMTITRLRKELKKSYNGKNEKGTKIVSVKIEPKYDGYWIKYYTYGDNWTSETKEANFEHIDALLHTFPL